MKVYIAALFVSLTISTISAQTEEIFDGPCPAAVNPPSNFSHTQFSGNWFEIKRYNNKIVTNDCGSPTYTLSGDNYNVSYPTRNIKTDTSYNTQLLLKSSIFPKVPGKYNVIVNGTQERINLLVVNTDYTNYGIVWGCDYNAPNNKSTQQLFIYSRTNTLSEANIKIISKTLTDKGINYAKSKDVEQDNKKCKRGSGSGAALVFPSVITGIIMLLIRSMF